MTIFVDMRFEAAHLLPNVPVEDDGKVPGWLFFVPITVFATIVFIVVALID